MEKYEGQLKNFNFNLRSVRSHHSKKKNRTICDNIFCFDTESTSAWITEKNEVIGYTKGLSEDYWNSLNPISITYIWMFGCEDSVYYGRTADEFLQLLEDLPDAEIIIYIHNLAYDFNSFLMNVLEFTDVFARSPHKPIYAKCKEFPKITFKCSYTLTGLSLDSWGKQIGVHKKKGQLDYLSELRTPLSELSTAEMEYCEFDIKVMTAGLRKYVERFGSLDKIPLTKTGIIRNHTKEILCCEYYVKQIKRLVPKNAEQYHLLMDVFTAGYTHANRYYALDTITTEEFGFIGHKDFASSYPTWEICGKMPCSPWVVVGEFLPDLKDIEEEAYIIIFEAWEIESICFNTYISSSKCFELKNAKFDNGRVISAEHLCIKITELDYDIIRQSYKWKKAKSRCTWNSHKDYLPDDFREYILELYHAKTAYKNIEGMEDIYMAAKSDINSTFGMAVSALMYADIIFKNGEWETVPLTADLIDQKLADLRKKWWTDKRYFLNYSWGIWIATLGRWALWRCILSLDTPAKKNNVLYCDTDSIFYTGHQDFSWYDKEIDERLKAACEEGGLDFEKTRPVGPDGKSYPLGHFTDEDDHIVEFRTMGAKRYVYRDGRDNKLHLTISGVNKGAVDCLDNDIENFKKGFVFDKDNPSVHKLLHTYNIEQPEVVFPDGYVNKYKFGVNLRPTGYTLDITDEYERLNELFDLDVFELSDHAINRLRGAF